MNHEEGSLTRWWRGAVGFLRWLSAREQLAESTAAQMPGAQARGARARWLLATEHLPPAGPPAEADARTGFWRWLSGGEQLPPDSSAPATRRPGDPFFAWLFRPERLASDGPASPSREVAFFSWLFHPERIPAPGRTGGHVMEREDGTE